MQNVFAITQKSINHFINMFSSTNNTLEDYVRTEYKPTDWKWAYQKFVLQNKKKQPLVFRLTTVSPLVFRLTTVSY